MGECKLSFDSGDYRDFLETGLSDPQTGDAILIGVHNECRGASAFSQSDFEIETSDLGDLAGYAAGAEDAMRDTIENAAGTLLMAYQPFIGKDAALTQSLAGINLFEPNSGDATAIRDGLGAVADAIDQNIRSASGIEYEELLMAKDDVQAAYTDISTMIETSDDYAVMHDVVSGLQGLGFPAAEIKAAMTPEVNVNEPNLENTQIMQPNVFP